MKDIFHLTHRIFTGGELQIIDGNSLHGKKQQQWKMFLEAKAQTRLAEYCKNPLVPKENSFKIITYPDFVQS